MAEVKKTFEGTYEDENGNIHAIPKVDVPEGKREGVKITKFEETKVDENGNLIASGRDSNMPKEGVKAKKITEFDSFEEDENGNIIVHRKPDVNAI